MISSLVEEHSPKKQMNRFKYAFEGVWHALLNEANFRVQVAYAIFVVIIGFYFGLTSAEWAVMILAMGMLLSAELSNTAIEAIMDNMMPDFDPRVKIIKDVSAAFVLIMAITVLIISALIFFPYFDTLLS